MANEIYFTGDRTYRMGGISFKAIVDGKVCACVISEEALQDHFGAFGVMSLESTFDSNRSRIEQVAREMIAGKSCVAGKLVIRTGDI